MVCKMQIAIYHIPLPIPAIFLSRSMSIVSQFDLLKSGPVVKNSSHMLFDAKSPVPWSSYYDCRWWGVSS
jgi:hypothetical protein